MKKVFMSAAVVAMMVAAVSCQCNNNKKAEEACEGECTECTEKCEEANCEKACCDSTKTLKDAVEGRRGRCCQGCEGRRYRRCREGR